jgi:hypothetical protein
MFEMINPIFKNEFLTIKCPVIYCNAKPNEPCKNIDGSELVGFYGPSPKNIHKARAIKYNIIRRFHNA